MGEVGRDRGDDDVDKGEARLFVVMFMEKVESSLRLTKRDEDDDGDEGVEPDI